MEAERLAHLQLLEASDDPVEQTYHRNIARWIRRFLDPDTGIEVTLRGHRDALKRALQEREGAEPNTAPSRPYMSPDSAPSLTD